MIKDEDIIAYEDIGGWPVYKMNIREMLESLGGKIEGDKLSFDLNNPIMNVYPVIVHDDGMGYGIDEEFVVEINKGEDYITIFREKEDKDRDKRLSEQF